MKYFSIGLIILAALVTLLTNSGFENADSAEIIASILSLFLAPFYTATSGASVEAIPFYLINRNSTYILITTGVILCLVASAFEIVKLIKLGRNQQSACVITISVCLLYFNARIFVWIT